jgi:hypothetical protein
MVEEKWRERDGGGEVERKEWWRRRGGTLWRKLSNFVDIIAACDCVIGKSLNFTASVTYPHEARWCSKTGLLTVHRVDAKQRTLSSWFLLVFTGKLGHYNSLQKNCSRV